MTQIPEREPTVEPRDVDDMLDALEDRVGSVYLVVDFLEHTEGRGATIRRYGSSVSTVSTVSHSLTQSQPSASARTRAATRCTRRLETTRFSNATTTNARRSLLREVRFETKDWLGFETHLDASRRFSNACDDDRDDRVRESEIVNLESFLALCAASRRNLPMYVSRDVADAAGIAPFAWRSSFRSVRRMSDPPAFRRLAPPRPSAGRVTGLTTHGTRLDADLEAHFEENAIGALFGSLNFLRGVAESVADAAGDAGAAGGDAKPETTPAAAERPTRLQGDGNARGVPLARPVSARRGNETRGSSLDLGEALLGGPVVFFRAAMRAWADWHRKTTRTRKPGASAGNALAAEGLAIRRPSSPPPSADALRRLTGEARRPRDGRAFKVARPRRNRRGARPADAGLRRRAQDDHRRRGDAAALPRESARDAGGRSTSPRRCFCWTPTIRLFRFETRTPTRSRWWRAGRGAWRAPRPTRRRTPRTRGRWTRRWRRERRRWTNARATRLVLLGARSRRSSSPSLKSGGQTPRDGETRCVARTGGARTTRRCSAVPSRAKTDTTR